MLLADTSQNISLTTSSFIVQRRNSVHSTFTCLVTFIATSSPDTMGCGMSTEDKEGKARNEEIENQLKRDKMMQRNEIKMLLLGMTY